MIPVAQQIVTHNARMWLGGDGITRYEALPGAQVELADAVATHKAVLQLQGTSRHPLLVDIRAVKSISLDARRYFAGPEHAPITTSAVALLIESPVSELIGRFFLRLDKPHFPLQLFSSETEALSWLQGYLP